MRRCRDNRQTYRNVSGALEGAEDSQQSPIPPLPKVTSATPALSLQNVTVGMTTLGRSIWRRETAQHERVSKRAEAVAKNLGKRIRQLRTSKGWSQEHLADEAGMHRTYLWGIEQGVRNPSIRHLTQLADALGVTVASLFTAE